jgi:hypothetical protein
MPQSGEIFFMQKTKTLYMNRSNVLLNHLAFNYTII